MVGDPVGEMAAQVIHTGLFHISGIGDGRGQSLLSLHITVGVDLHREVRVTHRSKHFWLGASAGIASAQP